MWKDTEGLRQVKKILGDFNRGRSKNCKSLCKKSLRLLIAFLLEHCILERHLHKLGIVDDEFSTFCGAEEETPKHLIKNFDVNNGHKSKKLWSTSK